MRLAIKLAALLFLLGSTPVADNGWDPQPGWEGTSPPITLSIHISQPPDIGFRIANGPGGPYGEPSPDTGPWGYHPDWQRAGGTTDAPESPWVPPPLTFGPGGVVPSPLALRALLAARYK